MKDLAMILKKHGIPVKSVGSAFLIPCPFHAEVTPSCSVRATGFHCFGCTESGSISKLLIKLEIMERPTFDLLQHKQDVLTKLLGDKLAGVIGLPTDGLPFVHGLKGITEETFKIFGVFTSPHYKDRIVIPIYYNGKLRGLIKRNISDGQYDVQFYDGYTPLNIDKIQSNKLIIVEGSFDLFSVYQAGFHNVVASLSSSNSYSLVKWLNQISATNVYILYDGDNAGRRGAQTLNNLYPDSTILELPEGLDPNDYGDLQPFLKRNIK